MGPDHLGGGPEGGSGTLPWTSGAPALFSLPSGEYFSSFIPGKFFLLRLSSRLGGVSGRRAARRFLGEDAVGLLLLLRLPWLLSLLSRFRRLLSFLLSPELLLCFLSVLLFSVLSSLSSFLAKPELPSGLFSFLSPRLGSPSFSSGVSFVSVARRSPGTGGLDLAVVACTDSSFSFTPGVALLSPWASSGPGVAVSPASGGGRGGSTKNGDPMISVAGTNPSATSTSWVYRILSRWAATSANRLSLAG